MRCVAICSVVILVGCAKADKQPPRAAEPPAASPSPISLASVAGKWRVRGFNAAGDSIVGYQLTATGNTSGWTNTFPNRQPIPVSIVAVAGDSIIAESGPYASVLRRGVQVRTRTVFRLHGDTLVGTTVAHYATTARDSVLQILSKGTRIP